MSIVTYGYGKAGDKGALVASYGYGIAKTLFPPITDVVGQIVDITGRVWSVAVARSWSVELRRPWAYLPDDRIREVLAVTRTSIVNLTRSFAVWLARVFSVRGDE